MTSSIKSSPNRVLSCCYCYYTDINIGGIQLHITIKSVWGGVKFATKGLFSAMFYFVPACCALSKILQHNTISNVGRLLGQRLSIRPARHLFQKIAISLWRGNTTAWINRSPSLVPSLDGVMWPGSLCLFCTCFCFVWVFGRFFVFLFDICCLFGFVLCI